MTIARYSFLPWLRRGIATEIQAPATASRATVSVAVTVASDAAATPLTPKAIQLIGPADVIGFQPHLVIRTEPRNWITDFEPNYLAFIEFYDEDFAWRYTPTAPDAAHRLAPWVALLVLKDSEFDADNRPGRPLSSIRLKGGVDPKSVLPSGAQLWAWAHVHVNENLGAGHAPNLDALDTVLRRNPDTGFCRLLSPRRLEPETAYHAFVIPTFEVGRKACLGLAVADTDPALDLAWQSGTEFPVYYEWRFRTAAAGDFEELVRALKPRPMPKEVGIRDLDIHDPDFGLPPIVSAPDHLVGLEGALLSPFTEPKPLHPASNFPPEIVKEVNRAADDVATGPGASDPIVTAPLYGRWHALVERVSALPEHRNWVNELNTDPRFRAPAGMGTRVIQKNQEEYMKQAWQQIGEILAANRKVHFLQMAVKASQSAYVKHLAPLGNARALTVLSPTFSKVMGSPVTVRYLVHQSRLTPAAMSGPMRKHLRPRGPLVRRAVPPGSRTGFMAETIRQLNDGAISAAPPRLPPAGPTLESAVATVTPHFGPVMRWLISQAALLAWLLLLVVIFVALALSGIAGIALLVAAVAAIVAGFRQLRSAGQMADAADALSPANLTVEAVAAIPPNPSFVLAPAGEDPPNGPVANGADGAEARDFRVALSEFHALLGLRVPAAPMRTAIGMSTVHETVMRAVEPVRAFPRRAATFLRVGDSSIVAHAKTYADAASDMAFERIVPAMAYPDIKTPMYAPLRDISADLFVPNLDLIPRNTISLMVQNMPFIEAYMVGLNHEFARELLWREYPTDQRPSTFRQFWDASNYVNRDGLDAKALAEKIRDITRIHEWRSTTRLGDHSNRGLKPTNDPNKRTVVLVIRGDLLKRYPNTIIYAQHATWGRRPETLLKLVLWDETGEKSESDPRDDNIRFPLYKAQVEPDIHFVGFDLTIGEVHGSAALAETADAKARLRFDELGWFFVIKEVVGEPRFGLDEHTAADAGPNKWDSLSWEHLGPVSVIDLSKPFVKPLPAANPDAVNWGTNAADMAHILYQKPVLVAVHARDMLEGLK